MILDAWGNEGTVSFYRQGRVLGRLSFRLPMSDKLRASRETLILPKLQLGVTVGVQFCGTVLTVYEF